MDPVKGDRRHLSRRCLRQDSWSKSAARCGEEYYKREYLGIPGGRHASPFAWELYERSTNIHVPLVRPGQAFTGGLNYIRMIASTWPGCKPLIIAHDVGRSRDRSTAVVGGNSPYGRTSAWHSRC